MNKMFVVAALLMITAAEPQDGVPTALSPAREPSPTVPHVQAESVPILDVAIMPERLAVDPQTNTASASILIANSGPDAVDLLIMADDFTPEGSTEGMSAKVLFGINGETPSKPEFQQKLAKNERLRIRMDVSNLWQAGVSRSRLMNHAQKIGDIVAVKSQFPFNVGPLGWKGDTPFPLRFEQGSAPLVILKNDDLQSYDVDWSVTSSGLPGKKSARPVHVGGQSTEVIQVPEGGWLPGKYNISALLNDVESDGLLKLVATDQKGERRWKSRDIPLRIQRSYWSAVQRSFLTFLLLALLVSAGGIASLLVTHWMPNRLRRITVRELIESTSTKIRALTNMVYSSLRVGVRVERTRLLQRLHSRSAISPDFAALAKACEASAHRLIHEIEMLERVDQLMRQIETNWPSAGVHGPTLLRRACVVLYDAQATLERPEVNDAEVAAADALIQQAATTIDNAETLDEAATKFVSARLTELKALLKEPGRLGCKASLKEILDSVPGLKDGLEFDVANLASSHFSDIDTTSTKLDLVARFVETWELLKDDAAKEDSKNKFIEALRRTGFTDFRRAEALTEQVREEVFVEDVKREIEAGRVSIVFEPQSPKVNQAVSFRIDFRNTKINNAAARNAIVYEWEFDHATAPEEEPGIVRRSARWIRDRWRKFAGYTPSPVPRQKWREKALAVSHYFPAAETFTVMARFFDEDGEPLKNEKGDAVVSERIWVAGAKRRPWGERTKIEALRLIIVLLITVAGLLIGARDELAKLDLIPGLIAVFMIGFTADQIKNILGPPGPT
ncbi:MAG: hypothetical protein AABO58_02355 [Acidobacteriota bacterium]